MLSTEQTVLEQLSVTFVLHYCFSEGLCELLEIVSLIMLKNHKESTFE